MSPFRRPAALSTGAAASVALSGLWSGLVTMTAQQRLPLWDEMSPETYSQDFRGSLQRTDPMTPVVGLLATTTTLLFAIRATGPARLLSSAGAALQIGALVTSAFLVPIEAAFREPVEGTPDDAVGLRKRWRRGHRTRTALILGALGLPAAGAAA